MPTSTLTRLVLLPELEFRGSFSPNIHNAYYFCDKKSKFEICPRCASKCTTVYDHRKVRVKDHPIRGKLIYLEIRKRRFWCKKCKKPFTEPVQGILPRRRTTQRYRRGILWACENFSDLTSVRRAFRCSSDFVYQALYEQLELKRRTRQYPWPHTIGVDEHCFKRNRGYGYTEFASLIVDHKNKRPMELVRGKTSLDLQKQLIHIPGRENVRYVTLDMCDPFKNFALSYFPNATLVADKFHVLRLLNPAIHKYRKEITGDRRTLKIRKLLLTNSQKIDPWTKHAMHQWLEKYPDLKEIYSWKERLYGFYRIRGYNRAKIVLIKILDQMALSTLKEVKTLRRTLQKWFNEILSYFKTRLTNARTEGFNNRAKLVQRRAYGYKNFNNYRLRLLNLCF